MTIFGGLGPRDSNFRLRTTQRFEFELYEKNNPKISNKEREATTNATSPNNLVKF